MKQPFQFSGRWTAAIFLTGQVLVRLFKGRLYRHKILEHMVTAGPGALLPVLLVTGASGMIFTLQMGRYLSEYNALNALGGAFGEAFCRELAPILTASVVAGQVGSAFAAEIGAMRVTEQIDALQMLRTDPIDYLVVPRTIACCLMVPMLTILALTVGLGAGTAIASQLYQVSAGTFLDSVQTFLSLGDIAATLLKAFVFGAINALVGCSCGLTTKGGAKEVGQSATTAVVTTWILIFLSDFALSLLFYGKPIL
ncbi:MAG: MlaE family lipid ABC transporter permease subunit [Jaaginema sp. PMC 1079.18]|nr:MlaE family lipid ABC transporter permease subunit [Jaaginema sp. PMC 1080.18]MEC4849892.1 MlaE family lipid ABC transporter permease subunit [Jaaginema sp. PMC 1079.18]MEC4866840.1 MlaE family lipid ABC transporter permease subunit [Jaaginema sp. PMC 1078.18]